MGRMLPVECEHGRVIDWGDFGPNQDDGSVGAQHCEECASTPPPALADLVREWPAEAVRLLVEAGVLEPIAWRCPRDGMWSVGAVCAFGGEHIPIEYRLVPSDEGGED